MKSPLRPPRLVRPVVERLLEVLKMRHVKRCVRFGRIVSANSFQCPHPFSAEFAPTRPIGDPASNRKRLSLLVVALVEVSTEDHRYPAPIGVRMNGPAQIRHIGGHLPKPPR